MLLLLACVILTSNFFRSAGSKPKANKRVGTPAEEVVDQSVFPVRTPDKEGWLGPLSDLLEEEITLPGESRQPSAEGARKNWAFLPPRATSPGAGSTTSSSDVSSSSSQPSQPSVGEAVTWEQRVEQALGEGVAACAAAAREAEDELVASAVATLEGSAASASTEKQKKKAAASEDAKKRAISAKSHIFRKGKVDAARYQYWNVVLILHYAFVLNYS